mmetsp:Transcript_21040/g.58505  ORF Transcript_21040/g.58505 Transcript_21040/m.58505 type:complete len:282 (-) Transcript_21040:321-1166(-)
MHSQHECQSLGAFGIFRSRLLLFLLVVHHAPISLGQLGRIQPQKFLVDVVLSQEPVEPHQGLFPDRVLDRNRPKDDRHWLDVGAAGVFQQRARSFHKGLLPAGGRRPRFRIPYLFGGPLDVEESAPPEDVDEPLGDSDRDLSRQAVLHPLQLVGQAGVSFGAVLVLELCGQCLGGDPNGIAPGRGHDLGFQGAQIGVDSRFFLLLVVAVVVAVVVVASSSVDLDKRALFNSGFLSEDFRCRRPSSDAMTIAVLLFGFFGLGQSAGFRVVFVTINENNVVAR